MLYTWRRPSAGEYTAITAADVATADGEHENEPDARHGFHEEARDALAHRLPQHVHEQLVRDVPRLVEHALLGAPHLDHANARRHLEEALVERAHGVALELGRFRDLPPEPVRRQRADRHRDQADDRELGTHHPRDDGQPEEARGEQHDVAHVERHHPHALEIEVRRHHQVALAVLVEEPHGERQQLGDHLLHRAHFDRMREARRHDFADERADGPQDPDPENDQRSDRERARRHVVLAAELA